MTPKLLLVKSYVYTCSGCKQWVERHPVFLSDDFGKGYSCQHCGCTSVTIRDGRPFGSRSHHWEWIKDVFDWCWAFIYPPSSIVTEPPLETISEWQENHSFYEHQ